MFHKCSKKDTTATNEKEKKYFLFQGLFAFDMVLAWSVLNANKKEERPIHGWVWQSSKAFEVFLWTRCNPNWDQLGWAAPLQNIVFASVGPMVCCSHEYKSFLQPPPSSKLCQGSPPVECGAELVERGAQRGLAPAEKPQPARPLLQQNQVHRGEHFCW